MIENPFDAPIPGQSLTDTSNWCKCKCKKYEIIYKRPK